MNTESKNLSPTTLLFRGVTTPVKLVDATSISVRIWILPVRHLLELVDLFGVGKEAELISRCVQRVVPPADAAQPWTYEALDANTIDNLSDESHARLVATITELNFKRAVSNAERQIASGQALLPVTQAITKVMMEPIKHEMTLLMKSLTSVASSTAPSKQH